MEYFISDTHFNHNNIIKYCNRPFKDIEDMNESLVASWNEVVGPEDTVYFLGDFCLGNRNEVIKFGHRLNGHKILIMGNHDRATRTAFLDAGFDEVYKKPTVFNFGGKELLLSHAPNYDTEYDNVFGHVHTELINDEHHFCACVEQIGYKPISVEEVKKYFEGQL